MLKLWHQRCGRITSSGDYIQELDGLRFVALFMVFLIHLNHSLHGTFMSRELPLAPAAEWFIGATEFGALGVQLFFCISGFILGKPFAEAALCGGRKVPLSAFYLRRLTRLEPPLIIHLTILLGLYLVYTGSSLAEAILHYLATCTYLHSAIYGAPSIINSMTWSLEVEAQFYLSTPLLCLLFWIRSRVWRRLIILSLMVAAGIFAGDLPRSTLPCQLPYFLAGFLLVDLYLNEWKHRPEPRIIADLAGIASVGLFCLICSFHKDLPATQTLTALSMFGFIASAFRGRWLSRLFRTPFLATTGGMCYTFYLYHFVIIAFCARFLNRFVDDLGYFPSFILYLVVIGAINWVVCSILFILFERPFMSWRPRRGMRLNGLSWKSRP